MKDRDAHLHALADHLLPLHLKLVGKLGGRQVIGHRRTSHVGEWLYYPILITCSGGVKWHFSATWENDSMEATSISGSAARPRRGRVWVIAALLLATIAIGYAIVDISTKEAGRTVVRVAGIADAQQIFGGVPQAGDRLGSADAPVSIQVFNDLQCSSCRVDFLSTIPGLVEGYARPGDAKLLMRHYSVSSNPVEIGFYGAEAAAAQGYGWQYTYLFFRNQDEAERFGIDDDFMGSLAGSIGELDVPQWRATLDREGGADGSITGTLDGYEKLCTDLGIRTRQAAIVSGRRGTRTLQDAPTLAQIEAAIASVR
jgi:Thioredoxin